MSYRVLAVLIGCALALAACGVRGDLELPPQTVAAPGADDMQQVRKPERPFLLDPLL